MQAEQITHEQADLSLSSQSPEVIQQIRSVFIQNEYTRRAMETFSQIQSIQQTDALSESPINPLTQLFVHSKPATKREVNDLIQPMTVESWVEVGLVMIKKDIVIPLVKITPYKNLLIASDIQWQDNEKTKSNVVPGLTTNTAWLANLTVRKQSKLTLDLGTGSGCQALLAAAHSEKVIATDVNPRALEFARFNAALNNITNIEFIQSNLFESFKGQKFDLILSNPPSVISPEDQYLYRDNELDGDQLIQQMINELPEYLSDNGYGQIICNWVQQEDKNWQQTMFETFHSEENTDGCDKLFLRLESYQTEQYARGWLAGLPQKKLETQTTNWMKYYDEKGIDFITAGLVTLRKTTRQSTWFRAEDTPRQVLNDAGQDLARIFNLQDFLDQHPTDQGLMKERFRIAPNVRLLQESMPQGNGWQVTGTRMQLTSGIAHTADVIPDIMAVVYQCDGKFTLGEILKGVASIRCQEVEIITPNYVAPIRQLITYGFLWPVQESATQVTGHSIADTDSSPQITPVGKMMNETMTVTETDDESIDKKPH